MIIIPIINFVLSTIYSFFEIKYDKKIVDAIPNRKTADLLIHDLQMPFRVASGLAISLALILISILVFDISSKTIILGIVLNTLVNLWITIDVIAAVWWLKKPWWYIGDTADTDEKLNNPVINWTIKLGLLAGSLILILWQK